MFMRGASILAGILSLTLGQAAWACQGTKVLFDDKFAQSDPAWGGDPDHFIAQGGKLEIKLPPTNHWFNQNNVYGDSDVCATVALDSGKEDSVSLGLAFWGLDDDHYYTFLIAANGNFSVLRKVAAGRFLSPISWRASPAIKKGLGESNEIEVVTKGNRASVFVNGTKVGEITGQPPDTGSLVGLYASGPDQGDTVIEVHDFRVAD